MLTIDDLSFSYSPRGRRVFDHFSLRIRSGRIYGLLGKNGTGKSTLLYLASGLLRAQSGAVRYEGTAVAARRPEVLREMMLVPEVFELPRCTLRQYVRLNRPFYPRFDEELLRSCLRDFELSDDIHLGALSMGQRKKALIAFALAAGTRLLLMDEPTNGLDIPSKSQFRKVVARSMSPDRTIVISTHQVGDVEMLVDHVAVIDGQGLRLDASAQHICSRLRFEARPSGAAVGDALYVQPSLAGQAVIAPAGGEDGDSSLNLELLFNALQSAPERITAQLSGEAE